MKPVGSTGGAQRASGAWLGVGFSLGLPVIQKVLVDVAVGMGGKEALLAAFLDGLSPQRLLSGRTAPLHKLEVTNDDGRDDE